MAERKARQTTQPKPRQTRQPTPRRHPTQMNATHQMECKFISQIHATHQALQCTIVNARRQISGSHTIITQTLNITMPGSRVYNTYFR
eukprot:547301_1